MKLWCLLRVARVWSKPVGDIEKISPRPPVEASPLQSQPTTFDRTRVAICLTAHFAIRLTAHFVTAFTILFPLNCLAQIIPDNTLRVNSTVTPNGNTLTINGGSRAGGNLFHSFQEFSLTTGSEAFFNNAVDVQNIFSRVTGNNISNIDGLIRANGGANLFLLNPNGIVFGPNARLNIGGSFIASTANSINFADKTQFSAINPQAGSLLTVSVPIGLGFGSNPAPIQVQGRGHNLTFNPTPSVAFPPFTREANPQALTVQPGRTLALVGGELILAGGQLVAERGRIELGSVGASGEVSLAATPSGFALDYQGVSNFQDIQLSQQALADASGSGGEGIHFVGRRVTLTNGSAALMQNSASSAPGGEITVNAKESLELIGTTPNATVRSSLNNESTGAGTGGAIRINTGRLAFMGGGQIVTRTYGTGAAGNITVNASDAIEVIGASPLNPRFFSSIFAIAQRTASGRAGDLSISTRRLTVLGGGIINAASYGNGSGGNLTLKAEVVELIGSDPIFNSPSDLNVGSFRTGNAGSLRIDTQRLVVRDGGRITASTIGSGNAGTLEVNASELVEISGNSSIESSVNSNSTINEVLGLRGDASGSAGGVTINTNRLIVRDGARVTVRNVGPRDGGTLQVNAGSIELDREATLTASTASGEGGNIILQANYLQMRRNSNITTSAGGTGNGGNLTINSDAIAALENSDITANAIQGRGGNISISTSGIFGTGFRPQPTSESDITASSQFGLSGTVAITNPEVDTRSFLVELPQNVVDSSQQISSGCDPSQGNTFTVAGRGGLPENPSAALLGRAVWWDNRDLSNVSQIASLPAQNLPKSEPPTEIVEATGWVINDRGQVELVAQKPHRIPGYNAPSCRPIVTN